MVNYKKLKKMLIWSCKQNKKVGSQLPTATRMAELEEIEPVPSILLPCSSCNRTFRPEALAKHAKVCEKTLMKKRKKFDSAKQRLQGTEIPNFPSTSKTNKKEAPIKTSIQSKWREKQADLARTLQAARKRSDPTVQIKPSDYEQCPHCERYFGPKAFDRHTEWCKEQQIKIKNNSNMHNEARERLQVRTKYRAPLTSKVLTTKEKYQPRSRDPSPMSVPKVSDEAQKLKNPLDRSSSLRISGRSRTVVVKNPVISPKILNETKVSNASSLSENRYDSSASQHERTKPKIYPEATPKKKMLVPPRVSVPRKVNKGGFKLNDTEVNHDIEELFVSSCVIHDPVEKGPDNLKIHGMEYLRGSGYVSSDSNLSGSQQSPRTRAYLDSVLGKKYKRKFQKISNLETITANEIKNFVDKNLAHIDEDNPVVSKESYTILTGLEIAENPFDIEDDSDNTINERIEKPKKTSIFPYTLSSWRDRVLGIAAKQFMQFLKWKSKQKAICFPEEIGTNILDEINITEQENQVFQEPSDGSSNDFLFHTVGNTIYDDFKVLESSDESFITTTSSSSCSCDSCKRNSSYMVKINKITEVKDAFTNMDMFDNFIQTNEIIKVESSDRIDTETETKLYVGDFVVKNDTHTSLNCIGNITINQDSNTEASELCCNKCLHFVAANIVEEIVSTAQLKKEENLIDSKSEIDEISQISKSENTKSIQDSNITVLPNIQETEDIFEFWNILFLERENTQSPSSLSEDSVNEYLENSKKTDNLEENCITDDVRVSRSNSINFINDLKWVSTPQKCQKLNHVSVQTEETTFKNLTNLNNVNTNLITWAYLATKDRNSSPISESTCSLDEDSLDNCYLNNDAKDKVQKDIEFEETAEVYSSSDWDCSSSNWHEERDNFTVHRKKVKYYETIEYKQDVDDFKTVKTSLYELPPLLPPKMNSKENHRTPTLDTTNWSHHHRVLEKNRMKWKSGCLSTIKLPPLKKPSSSSWDAEKYDPFASAEKQMLELFSSDGHKNNNNGDNTTNSNYESQKSPKTSPISAFAIYTPVNSNADSAESNENDNLDSDGTMSPPIEKIDNRKNFSLSNLSLCSIISLDSVDYNRNSRDKMKEIKRSFSAVETTKARQNTRAKLNMQQMLYGKNSPETPDVSPLNSNELGTLEACEAELLVSMLEFKKMLNSSPVPSIEPSSPFCSSSNQLDKMHLKDADEEITGKKNQKSSTIDSAYSSLTRAAGEGDTLKNEGSRFCHECGSRYPVPMAKFCCNCGIKRIAL